VIVGFGSTKTVNGGGELKQRVRWILSLCLVLPGAPLGAQLPSITVPQGLFRIELGGEFRHSDSRFHAGSTEDIGRPFTTLPMGSDFFPTLSTSEARIGAIIGNPTYRINLGRSTGQGFIDIGTVTIAAAYGLTRRLTVFGSVPIVKTRSQLTFRFDSSGADAGFNPNDPALGSAAGQIQTAAFFTEFDAALTTLGAKIANGDYDADPAQKALAQQALADGTSLRDGFAVVYADPDAPFVPTETSTAGLALTDTVAIFQATLAGLNVSGFSTLPALAATPISETDFDNFITAPAGPVRGFPLDEANLNLLGDIEAGISYGLVDNWNRGAKLGGFRAAVTGTVRFPTGQLDRPENFLDVGTGTGHFAARVTGSVDLGSGRWGARIIGGYEFGFPATLVRRVSGPFQPIAFASRTTEVQREPGDLLEFSAAPFFRLAPALAITGGVRLRHRTKDVVSYANDSLPGVDPAVLADETEWSLAEFQAGVVYVAPAAIDITRKGLPVEASWIIEGPLSESGGIVAKERTMRLLLRVFMKFFD
jgi:hypothetical protein